MANQEEHVQLINKLIFKSESSLCNYSDAYVLAKGNISVNNTAAIPAAPNNRNKK